MPPKFKQPQPAYHSYLVRCWSTPAQPNNGAPTQQRFVVEAVNDQPRRRGFDSLASLLAYLQTELASDDEQ